MNGEYLWNRKMYSKNIELFPELVLFKKPMKIFSIGDIVKIRDEYFEEFCGPKSVMGHYSSEIPLSPYAVVMSYYIGEHGYTIGGKRIYFYIGDENEYRLIYGLGDDKEDFSWWNMCRFELLTNQISNEWTNFCELSKRC